VPRYVILTHDHPELHWDLMLEAGPSLRTWRLSAPPQAGAKVRAEPSFDHRLLYLDYEGPVSGDRGSVSAWDRGTYALEGDGWAEGSEVITVHLSGTRLRGTGRLEREATGEWALWYDET
jgi:hypothetical protein